ncbi:acyl carrier protein [Streptomyces sp. VRA16 Mangrove soil]|uniref:acyl carrier protein n=1 Tax=Streptomyces sp. VRA16 Mangrove soil TaxID=2817434 RepID=UPI001A9D6516|nr:acyl carrier protein [Streptomyces sp. VRA16 Mangrove soil]MBO1333021.1 acyl carrier protein [Streptomyces sp. VRA16 Mangrove soil]
MTYEQALDLVTKALARVAPDADLATVGPDDTFREQLEIDSLDFLEFVEALAEQSGCRLDEDDYPDLVTLSGSARLLMTRTRV